jgi:hypothetical protein
MIFLVGKSIRGEYQQFRFNTSEMSSQPGPGPGAWAPRVKSVPPGGEPKEVERYESIVVEATEYAEAQAGFSTDVESDEPDVPATFRANQAAWARVAKRLYQEIDRHIEMEGLTLRRLEVTCGPDRSAASAEFRAGQSGLLGGLRPGPSWRQTFLKIDHLGDDVWYVKNEPDPRRPVPQAFQVEMEFLVSATGVVSKERRAELLAQGRAKQADVPRPASKWQVTLPNGATVEFIGLCESPSGGKEWWGPDGRPLGYAPYVNYERYGSPREARTIYEIAWRVSKPSVAGSGTRSSLEGCVGSYGRTIRDRYGRTIYEGLEVQGYAFEKARKTTTLTMGVRVGEGDYESVRFQNISLIPGADPGCEIIQGEAAAE